MPRHRSSAAPLAWLYAALIAYASLYPFVEWRVPGVSPFHFLTLPWPRHWTWFDLLANFFGYMPLGGLIFGAAVRGGGQPMAAFVRAALLGALLSFAMEMLQNFLPQRVSSNVDLVTNTLGTVLGAAMAWWLHRRGAVEHWQVARDRWFIRRSAGGLALLLLWPVGLLFPLPAPLAQGQVLPQLQHAVASLLDGTFAAPWVEGWAGDSSAERSLLAPGAEFALVALGLLAPCLVAFSITRPGWRRLLLVGGAAALGALTTTLSTALNFGPQHLLAWNTPRAVAALLLAITVAAPLSVVPRRACAGLGLMALTALVTLAAQAPADPFYAQSLQGWEQGRFIRFYGLAHWVARLWPYVAIVYLLARLGAANEAEPASPSAPSKMPA